VLTACRVFDPVFEGQHTTWHGGSLALRCTSLSYQQRHAQPCQRNSLEPTAYQSACVCGAGDTSSGVGEQKYL
jgi:hypothetical protein